MTVLSWITLALVGTVVWGGFVGLLTLALRREGARGRKPDARPEGN